jgi:predicted acyl esterase
VAAQPWSNGRVGLFGTSYDGQAAELVAGLGGVRKAIEATGVPMLIRAGWLDGAFAAGALRRLATFANQQEVEIGPWGHGGRTYADTLRPDGTLAGDRLVREGQDRRLVEFFTRYVERAEAPDGKRNLTFGTLAMSSSPRRRPAP